MAIEIIGKSVLVHGYAMLYRQKSPESIKFCDWELSFKVYSWPLRVENSDFEWKTEAGHK